MIFRATIEVMGFGCSSFCILLSSVTFESGRRLSQLEEQGLSRTGMVEIIVPASVEGFGLGCF
jgi:hypothetical protein